MPHVPVLTAHQDALVPSLPMSRRPIPSWPGLRVPGASTVEEVGSTPVGVGDSAADGGALETTALESMSVGKFVDEGGVLLRDWQSALMLSVQKVPR